MTEENDNLSQAPSEFISGLPERIKLEIDEANRTCGLSYELYEKLLHSAFESILHSAPESDKAAAEKLLKENGYDPEFEPYVAEPGECELTGIDIDCCPCGQHP